MNNHFDIKISVPDFFPDSEIADLVSDIQRRQTRLYIEKVRPEAYASMEWIMPTAIAAFITKSYFESFLSEAGKDHYSLLKDWLKKISSYSKKHFKSKNIAATHSVEKLSNEYTQSGTISIFIELKDSRRIKLLFDLRLEEGEWNKAIDELIDMVAAHYSSSEPDELTLKLISIKHKLIYGVIDHKTLTWIFLDDNTFHSYIKKLD